MPTASGIFDRPPKKDDASAKGDPLRPATWRMGTSDSQLGSGSLTFPHQCLLTGAWSHLNHRTWHCVGALYFNGSLVSRRRIRYTSISLASHVGKFVCVRCRLFRCNFTGPLHEHKHTGERE